jgi:hypothetical protein
VEGDEVRVGMREGMRWDEFRVDCIVRCLRVCG